MYCLSLRLPSVYERVVPQEEIHGRDDTMLLFTYSRISKTDGEQALTEQVWGDCPRRIVPKSGTSCEMRGKVVVLEDGKRATSACAAAVSLRARGTAGRNSCHTPMLPLCMPNKTGRRGEKALTEQV